MEKISVSYQEIIITHLEDLMSFYNLPLEVTKYISTTLAVFNGNQYCKLHSNTLNKIAKNIVRLWTRLRFRPQKEELESICQNILDTCNTLQESVKLGK